MNVRNVLTTLVVLLSLLCSSAADALSVFAENLRLASNNTYLVTVTFQDKTSFTFIYIPDQELLKNGDEYVIFELRKLKARLANRTLIKQWAIFFQYALPQTGVAEQNKDHIRQVICMQNFAQNSCRSALRLAIGKTSMDLSGTGNLAYGYFMESLHFSLFWQDIIASSAQIWNDILSKKATRFSDNPNDIIQRRVGVALSTRPLTAVELVQVAEQLGLY